MKCNSCVKQGVCRYFLNAFDLRVEAHNADVVITFDVRLCEKYLRDPRAEVEGEE